MKRITSACLEQTIRFDTYNDAKPEEDLKKFLELMDRKKQNTSWWTRGKKVMVRSLLK